MSIKAMIENIVNTKDKWQTPTTNNYFDRTKTKG